MPKKPNEELKTDSGIYHSKLRANNKYITEKTEQILLRVPKGTKEIIQNYVNTLPQYEVKGKVQHSVNAWLVDLINKELEKFNA